MNDHFRILMLLSDGYGGFGGISKFNMDFLEALNACELVERVQVLPRVITRPINRSIPESVVYNRTAANGKICYVRSVLAMFFQKNQINCVICGHLNLLPLAAIIALFHGVRLTLIIHGIESWARRGWLSRFATKTVGSVIAVSQFSAEKFTSWADIPLEKVFILPNSVDLNCFVPQTRSSALVEKYKIGVGKVILTLGRLVASDRKKGFDEVIALMPKLIRLFPDLKYLIVGDGPDRERLEGIVTAGGLRDNVIFSGEISEEEKVAHYNLADAYIMPSSGEGFGIVLIEAAACGIPIIGSRADGSREALLNGRLGRLVAPDDQIELLDAVTSVLNDSSPRFRNGLVTTFSVEKYNSRVANWLGHEYESFIK